jgi:hypothetical protein
MKSKRSPLAIAVAAPLDAPSVTEVEAGARVTAVEGGKYVLMTVLRVPPAPFLAGVAHVFDCENAVDELELLPRSRSATVPVTFAVSGYPPIALGVTTKLTVALALRFKRLQVTVGVAKLQEPWLGVAET